MIIFLYGKDTYRSKQKLQDIVESYQKIHKSGLNLKCFDGDDFNIDSLRDGIQQASMFEEKKLIVLRNVFGVKDEEKLLDFLKSVRKSEDIILVYEEKVKKDNPLYRFLKKQAKCQEFSLLEDSKLKIWLKKELSKYNIEISQEALIRLVNSAGNDLWQQGNEIKKLVNFRKGGRIEVGDVDLLVRPRIEADIFKTIDAMAQKNRKQALFLLHKHLEKGDNPLYLLSMISFQFRNLLIVKSLMEKNTPYYSIVKKSELHPFIVRKSYSQAGGFTFPELKKIYQRIFEVDLGIKTGRVNPEAGLDLLITEI